MVKKVAGKEYPVDMITKAFPERSLSKYRGDIGMRDLHESWCSGANVGGASFDRFPT